MIELLGREPLMGRTDLQHKERGWGRDISQHRAVGLP